VQPLQRRYLSDHGVSVSIVSASVGSRQFDRRMRRRRFAKVTLIIVFSFVWIPVAVVMVVAGVSDRNA